MVTDSMPASSHPGRDERPPPPSAATDTQIHEAARFVISPDGHADELSPTDTHGVFRGCAFEAMTPRS
jgi:hypothetical protein